MTPQPLYDMEAVERAAAELDNAGQGGDRLGDAVRNLAKLLDKATAELEATKQLSFKNGFEVATIAEDESGRWWMGCVPCDIIGTLRMGKARAERDRDEHNAGVHAIPAAPAPTPPAGSAPPEARGVVWRGWALGLQDWAEESQISDLDPTDKSGFGWNAALKAVCIAIVQATLGDFPYLVDPDCECEGQCPMCARWDCEQCCDGGMPADHGVKEGIVVRTPEKP